MLSVKKYIQKPTLLLLALLMKIGTWLPDEIYLRVLFRLKNGYWLNLKNPITFCEKIQWLKLFNRKDEYSIMVDKFLVKKYVSDIIGEKYIIPTLGIWKSVEDINWNILPKSFVLKTTHGGGNCGVIICNDKDKINKDSVIQRLNKSLNQDIYRKYREWPYKNVKKRIMAEEYVMDLKNHDLIDYKFFCFNGNPVFCQVIQNRRTKETIDFFDMNWMHQDFVGLNPLVNNADIPPVKPVNLDLMKSLAARLSKNIPFVRVDFYDVNDKVYFGEITFFPASGFGAFSPDKWNLEIGKLINL